MLTFDASLHDAYWFVCRIRRRGLRPPWIPTHAAVRRGPLPERTCNTYVDGPDCGFGSGDERPQRNGLLDDRFDSPVHEYNCDHLQRGGISVLRGATTTTTTADAEGTSSSTAPSSSRCVKATVLVTATDPSRSQSVCLIVGGQLIVTLPGKSSPGTGPWLSAPETLNTSVVEPTATTVAGGIYVSHFTAIGAGSTEIHASYAPCAAIANGSTGCSLPLSTFQILVRVTS